MTPQLYSRFLLPNPMDNGCLSNTLHTSHLHACIHEYMSTFYYYVWTRDSASAVCLSHLDRINLLIRHCLVYSYTLHTLHATHSNLCCHIRQGRPFIHKEPGYPLLDTYPLTIVLGSRSLEYICGVTVVC